MYNEPLLLINFNLIQGLFRPAITAKQRKAPNAFQKMDGAWHFYCFFHIKNNPKNKVFLVQ